MTQPRFLDGSRGCSFWFAGVGYTAADIPQMVAGALQQQRLTKLSPRPCSEEELAELFTESIRYW